MGDQPYPETEGQVKDEKKTENTGISLGARISIAAVLVVSILALSGIGIYYNVRITNFADNFEFYPGGLSPGAYHLSVEEIEFVRPAVQNKLNEMQQNIFRIELERKQLLNSSGGNTLSGTEDNLASLRTLAAEARDARKEFEAACKSAQYFNVVEQCGLHSELEEG